MSNELEPHGAAFDVLRLEYERLKTEQAQRIQFRDNLLMAHLTVVGAVIGFIVSNAVKPLVVYAYLIIPWTSSILGWAYLNNDILISNIRDYIKHRLSDSMEKALRVNNAFMWEREVGNQYLWVVRKLAQTIMDTATFAVPSIGALWFLTKSFTWSKQPETMHLLFDVDWLITGLLSAGLLIWNGIEVIPARYRTRESAENDLLTNSSSQSSRPQL